MSTANVALSSLRIDTWRQIHMVGLWDVYHAQGGPEEAQ